MGDFWCLIRVKDARVVCMSRKFVYTVHIHRQKIYIGNIFFLVLDKIE